MVATATTIFWFLQALCAVSICWESYEGVIVSILPVTRWTPHLLSFWATYSSRISRERRLFAGAIQRGHWNENEGLHLPWFAAEDLRIGGLEFRWLLKILVSWNMNKFLAKFTANLLYRVARTLSVLLKAKIVDSSPDSQWYGTIGCNLLPTVFHSPRPSP